MNKLENMCYWPIVSTESRLFARSSVIGLQMNALDLALTTINR